MKMLRRTKSDSQLVVWGGAGGDAGEGGCCTRGGVGTQSAEGDRGGGGGGTVIQRAVNYILRGGHHHSRHHHHHHRQRSHSNPRHLAAYIQVVRGIFLRRHHHHRIENTTSSCTATTTTSSSVTATSLTLAAAASSRSRSPSPYTFRRQQRERRYSATSTSSVTSSSAVVGNARTNSVNLSKSSAVVDCYRNRDRRIRNSNRMPGEDNARDNAGDKGDNSLLCRDTASGGGACAVAAGTTHGSPYKRGTKWRENWTQMDSSATQDAAEATTSKQHISLVSMRKKKPHSYFLHK